MQNSPAKKKVIAVMTVKQPKAGKNAAKKAKKRALKAARSQLGGSLAVSARSNPYLDTILDAEEIRGVKLPDPITFPSSTYAFEYDGVTTADNSGNFIIGVNPLNIVNGNQTSNVNAIVVGTDPTATTVSGFGAPTKPLINLNGGTNPNIAGTVGQVRIVSGKIKAYATTSPLNTAGRMCSFALPRGAGQNGSINLSSLQNAMGLTYSYADHAVKGAEARYIPTDNVEHQYYNVATANNYAGWAFDGTNKFISAIQTGAGAFGVCGSGVLNQAGTAGAVIAFRVVINYEFLPTSDAVDFVNRSDSPDEPGWLNSVNQFVSHYGERLLMPSLDLLGAAANYVLPGVGSLGKAVATTVVPKFMQRLAASPNIGAATSSRYGRLPY